ncbi:DUF4265 domain-containing protein [Dyella mobilis]|uniref:DUF4265 domain-containing protein n=1 Tax=Dyella mobilis TaxID=1849582 RepID=A0ABS2KFX5_9GAMM|nr:DUF4265 domain-containing protein [Dyella mobilis]MBM7129672.1 DUF4265 domain-containing protein [Dyella mobilis]GLQ98062.1 hypothetical protein GCM10007863_24820 [Dyella mobilis]
MSESPHPDAKVLFRVPAEDGSAQVETLWATSLGNDHYRLDNSPFFAYSVSWQDVVYAPFDAGEQYPTFKHVVSKSGNRTLRVLLSAPADEGTCDPILDALVSLGCSFEGANRKYISVNVPAGVDLQRVRGYLIEAGATWEHADPTYDEFHANHAS